MLGFIHYLKHSTKVMLDYLNNNFSNLIIKFNSPNYLKTYKF